jgi:hypothetical protein
MSEVKDDRASATVDSEATLVDVNPPTHPVSDEQTGRLAELDPVVASALARFGDFEQLEDDADAEPTIPEGMMRWLDRVIVRKKPVHAMAHARESGGADAASYATTARAARSVGIEDPADKVVVATEVRRNAPGDPSRELPTVVGVPVRRKRSRGPMLVAAAMGATFAAGIGVRGWLDARSGPASEVRGDASGRVNAGTPSAPPGRPSVLANDNAGPGPAAPSPSLPGPEAAPKATMPTPVRSAAPDGEAAAMPHPTPQRRVGASRPTASAATSDRTSDDDFLFKEPR